jgi:hypothetical protein
MHRRYNLWLLTCPKSFWDRSIWREDANSYAVQTPFQRAVGVRYFGKHIRRKAYVSSVFGNFGRGKRPDSVANLLKGHFYRGPFPRHCLFLRSDHGAVLARATGYVYISARHLRNVSTHDAVFVGAFLVRMGSGN